MNIYQLLANGTIWVEIVGSNWYGPFADYSEGFQWCMENRPEGAQIRSRGVLKTPPDEYTNPSQYSQGDDPEDVPTVKTEGAPIEVTEEAIEALKAVVGAARGALGDPEEEEEEEEEALPSEELGKAWAIRFSNMNTIVKIAAALGGLTDAELAALKSVENRVGAVVLIGKEIDKRESS